MSLVYKEDAHADALSPFSALAEDVLCNQRVKLYPDGNGGYVVGQVLTYNKDIFTPEGWEKRAPSEPKRSDVETLFDTDDVAQSDVADDVTLNDVSSDRAFRRARNNCFDYVMSNYDLDMFVTLTLSSEAVERTNYEEIYTKLRNFLDNRVRRNGLKYILIPEYHKDGKSIHFHGLMNEIALALVASDVKRKGKRVYNISDYTLGYSTAIRVTGADSRRAVSRYCFKYMTKSLSEGLIGGRYYLHGGKLERPLYKYYKTDFETWDVGNDAHEIKVGKYLRCFVQTF